MSEQLQVCHFSVPRGALHIISSLRSTASVSRISTYSLLPNTTTLGRRIAARTGNPFAGTSRDSHGKEQGALAGDWVTQGISRGAHCGPKAVITYATTPRAWKRRPRAAIFVATSATSSRFARRRGIHPHRQVRARRIWKDHPPSCTEVTQEVNCRTLRDSSDEYHQRDALLQPLRVVGQVELSPSSSPVAALVAHLRAPRRAADVTGALFPSSYYILKARGQVQDKGRAVLAREWARCYSQQFKLPTACAILGHLPVFFIEYYNDYAHHFTRLQVPQAACTMAALAMVQKCMLSSHFFLHAFPVSGRRADAFPRWLSLCLGHFAVS